MWRSSIASKQRTSLPRQWFRGDVIDAFYLNGNLFLGTIPVCDFSYLKKSTNCAIRIEERKTSQKSFSDCFKGEPENLKI